MKINYQLMMEEILKDLPKTPKPKLLLHACCAPCSSYVLEVLSAYFEITIYYYNPNIFPKKEFSVRADEIEKLIKQMDLSVKLVVAPYENELYEKMIQKYKEEKEGGLRCFICYEMRLDKVACYAKENHFDFFATTLSISPYKNAEKLNEIGEKLATQYNISYLYADFKKKNGYKRSIELSSIYHLYRQDYCGCIYSRRREE